jgi:glycosyltransferase involved in cell wall biosynthesis
VNKSYQRLDILVPVFNEDQNIRPFVEAVSRALERSGSGEASYRILFIDDGSTDGTWAAIEAVRVESSSRIDGIRLSRNFGKESAIAAGLEHAQGDLVLLMDGDLQHPPSLIPEMIRIWRHNPVEIVEAIKEDRGEEGLFKQAMSRGFYRLFNHLAGLDLGQASDMKLLSRKAVDAWLRLPEKNLFFRGMSAWIGFPRATVPFSVPARIHGMSGWRGHQLAQLALSAITAFSSAPLRLIALSGLLFGLFALLLGVQTLFNYFSGHAVSGFTTVIILMLLIGATLMFGLSIIGEYISRIYEEIKGRPRYLIDQHAGDIRRVEPR